MINQDGINIVNPSQKEWTSERFILNFGAYGWVRLMVWADNLQDALDECIDWIREYEPSMLCDDEVNEAYQEAINDGKTEEEAIEIAEQDTITGGNFGNRILSYEWGIIAENPSREQIKSIQSN